MKDLQVAESAKRKLAERTKISQPKRPALSALQRQLKGIEQENATIGGPTANSQGKIRHASILFDESESASLDLADIRALALSALQELQAADPAFVELQGELFPEDKYLAEHFDRSLLTTQENAAVDALLYKTAMHLVPHMELPASHQLLEWLIRAYRINEMSLDALFAALMPWHDTPVFVRCVQACYFRENDKWGFLFSHVKQQANSISREFIAKRLLVDRGLLDDHLIPALKWACENKPSGVPMYASFVTAILLQYVNLLDADKDTSRFVVIQGAAASMTRLASHDAQIGGYLIFMSLLAKFAPLLDNLADVAREFVESSSKRAVRESLPYLSKLEHFFDLEAN